MLISDVEHVLVPLTRGGLVRLGRPCAALECPTWRTIHPSIPSAQRLHPKNTFETPSTLDKKNTCIYIKWHGHDGEAHALGQSHFIGDSNEACDCDRALLQINVAIFFVSEHPMDSVIIHRVP